MVLVLGLALFLGGIYLFARYTARLASDDIKAQVRQWSNRTWPAILTGFVSTVITQSSSLISSLAVVSAGARLLTIRGGILIFFGADIGTTILDQLIASPLLTWGPWIILSGVIFYLFNHRYSRLASIVLLAIGLIFWGINLMSGALSGQEQILGLQYLDYFVTHPWVMFGFGILLTALIQSSSASTGIMLALVISGTLPPEAVIPFFLGADIGTTITENIASLATNWRGKSVARFSFVFSLIKGLIIMSSLSFFISLAYLITPDASAPAHLVANAHISFNVLAVLIALPFIKQLEKFAVYLAPVVPKNRQE